MTHYKIKVVCKNSYIMTVKINYWTWESNCLSKVPISDSVFYN